MITTLASSYLPVLDGERLSGVILTMNDAVKKEQDALPTECN